MQRNVYVFMAASAATAVMAIALPSPGGAAGGRREWKAPGSAAERRNPVPADARSTEAGRGLYARHCASCHGDSGRGDGHDGRDLEPEPTDLSTADVTAQSDGALFWKVTTGRKPMPSFRKHLSDEERWQVVNYLRVLAGGAGKERKS